MIKKDFKYIIILLIIKMFQSYVFFANIFIILPSSFINKNIFKKKIIIIKTDQKMKKEQKYFILKNMRLQMTTNWFLFQQPKKKKKMDHFLYIPLLQQIWL